MAHAVQRMLVGPNWSRGRLNASVTQPGPRSSKPPIWRLISKDNTPCNHRGSGDTIKTAHLVFPNLFVDRGCRTAMLALEGVSVARSHQVMRSRGSRARPELPHGRWDRTATLSSLARCVDWWFDPLGLRRLLLDQPGRRRTEHLVLDDRAHESSRFRR